MSLSLPNQVARHIWLLLLFLVVFLCDHGDATWCSTSIPVTEHLNESCATAKTKIRLGYYQLDNTTTAKVNNWELNYDVLLDHIDAGEGTCFMYRTFHNKTSACCKGFTGDECDTAICEPPCVNGICTPSGENEPNSCDCDSGSSGFACDENVNDLQGSDRYCFEDEFCRGAKTSLSVMPMMSCCDSGGGGAWGSDTNNTCTACEPGEPLPANVDLMPPEIPS